MSEQNLENKRIKRIVTLSLLRSSQKMLRIINKNFSFRTLIIFGIFQRKPLKNSPIHWKIIRKLFRLMN